MSRFLKSSLMLVLLLIARNDLHAQKNKCVNPAVRMFFFNQAAMPDGSTVDTAIRGDGNWYDGEINVCSGTGDATFVLSGKRKLNATFSSPIPNSATSLALAAGTYDMTFVNLRNIICLQCSVDKNQPYTTHLAIPSGTGRTPFALRFLPLVTDAPDLHIDPAVVPSWNVPFSTSPALVIPHPYNCASGGPALPSWTVRGTNPNNDPLTPAGYSLQVGTVFVEDQRAAEYNIPFELRVEAKSCFTY